MCIISNLPKGTRKDTQQVYDFIRSGYNCNGQGSGYMFKRYGEKKITVRKGFFNCDELIESIKSEKLGIMDELSVHHRIGTGGAVNGPNSHPFVISTDPSEVPATNITTNKPCLVHNGIFRNLDYFEMMNPQFSDTYAFARYVMTEPEHINLFIEDQNAFENKLRKVLGWSKITIMFPDRDMISYGEFIEDDGYFHSNGGYKSKVYDRGGSSTCKIPFLLEAPKKTKEEVKATTVDEIKKRLLKLDSSMIKLNSKNYSHFQLVKKDQFESSNNGLIFYEPLGFDEEAIMNAVRRRDGSDFLGAPIYRNITIVTRNLVNDYYYIPRASHFNIYKDLTLLINSNVKDKVGKTTIRLLKNILNSNHKKADDDKIFYKRFRAEFCKMSLFLFKEFLTKIYDEREKQAEEKRLKKKQKKEAAKNNSNNLLESSTVTS